MSKLFSLFVYLECSLATHSQHSVSLDGLVREAAAREPGDQRKNRPGSDPTWVHGPLCPMLALLLPLGLLRERSIAKASRIELLPFKHILC